MSRIARVLCLVAGFGVPTMAAACDGHPRVIFDKPATLEGVLSSGKGTHEVQGEFSYVYVTLDKPVCVDAAASDHGDEDAAQSIAEPVSRIQVAGGSTGGELPIGKHVAIDGTLFAAHTMWHVEDVLIDAADVQSR